MVIFIFSFFLNNYYFKIIPSIYFVSLLIIYILIYIVKFDPKKPNFHCIGKKIQYGAMDILFVQLVTLVLKQLKSILLNRASFYASLPYRGFHTQELYIHPALRDKVVLQLGR